MPPVPSGAASHLCSEKPMKSAPVSSTVKGRWPTAWALSRITSTPRALAMATIALTGGTSPLRLDKWVSSSSFARGVSFNILS